MLGLAALFPLIKESKFFFPETQLLQMLFIQGILEKQRKRNKNWQMSYSILANVCIGKCSIYISKCHKNQARQKIGKCLDQQMTYQQMYRLANVKLANVAQQMSGQQMSNWRMTAHRLRVTCRIGTALFADRNIRILHSLIKF